MCLLWSYTSNCLRYGLMRNSLSFIMKFIPVITIDLSLPVTSCSGNCWIWMLDSSRTGEKTILGRKCLCVRQESMGSPRVCTAGQSQGKGKRSGPCGQEWGGRTEPLHELQRSWNGKFHLRLVYKKLNNFQWLQNRLTSHVQSEIKSTFTCSQFPEPSCSSIFLIQGRVSTAFLQRNYAHLSVTEI